VYSNKKVHNPKLKLWLFYLLWSFCHPWTMTTANIPAAARPSNTFKAPSSTDPNALLDSLDAFSSNRAALVAKGRNVAALPSSLDPVDFLNRHYTTESMLQSQLVPLRTAVEDRMESLEDRISHALQGQSETADSTKRHVQDAKASVVSLERRIRLVQEKASQSERAVLEITKDMKRLDCAKRHLQRTITTLKRLHMLVHAVEQLRLACLLKPFPDYKSASHLVDATRLLLKHFEAYTLKIEPMRLLEIKVVDLQLDLKKGITRGFRIVGFGMVKALEMEGAPTNEGANGDESMATMTPQVMADGTLMVDSLGQDTRHAFLKTICEDHLNPYKTLFAPQAAPSKKAKPQHSFKIQEEVVEEKPAYALEQVERRFAWFRRLLRDMDERFPNVFPHYWNFQYVLTKYFLKFTHDHLLALLAGPVKDKDSQNATLLLKALQKTILFEKEMMAWLQRDYKTVFLVRNADGTRAPAPQVEDDEDLEFDLDGKAVIAASAEGIRIKYERQKREQLKGQKVATAALDEGRASVEQVPVENLVGVASSAFDDYMGPYIALEEQSMDEQLVESLADGTVDSRGELPVFTSSTSLFVYIKGSITRCTAMTKGKAFYLLFQAFQDSLHKYAQILSSKLPSPPSEKPSVAVGGLKLTASSFGKQADSGSSVIPPGGEITVCHVISTCEYCVDTVEALQDLIRDTIEPEFQEKIDMTNQQEAYHDVTAKSLRVLVSGLMNRSESALNTMQNIKWETFDEVGEESTYVRSVHKATEPFVALIRGLLPASYFRSFCDKFAMAFSTTYYDTLIRLKRISEQGSQQLLLDVYNIKTLFLKLPVIEATNSKSSKKGNAGSTIPPAMYTKMVTKQFKRIETLLKLVGTPVPLLVDIFKAQWVGGTALDLQTVMTLKGMKRPDMAVVLEKLGLDPATAMKGAAVGVTGSSIVSEHVALMREQSSDVAAKVNSDLSQMRQKVDDFRRAFR
jgi:vacuolar protein sorting-associated protein 53